MSSIKDPRYAFCEFLADQVCYVERKAQVMAEEYIAAQERLRDQSPSSRLSGVYLSVRRESRNGRLQIDWRKSKYKDNSPLSMRTTGRQFVKSEHVHRCSTTDFSYSRRNIKTAVRYGASWEFDIVWLFEKKVATLRRHAILLEELKNRVANLASVSELADLSDS